MNLIKESLIKQLRRDEGEVLYAYADSLSYLTLGVGRLVDKRKGGGITAEESAYLLSNDIDKRQAELLRRAPWMGELDPVRFAALQNMAFQLGVDGLLGFKNTLAMVRQGQYSKASEAMMESLWSRQTPERAKRLSEQMRLGVFQ